MIGIESSFKNSSVSERGAKGLMQLMPYVAEGMAQELGIEWTGDHNLFDPVTNVKLGIYYLTRLTNDFKNPGLALTAYNYGPSYTKPYRRQRFLITTAGPCSTRLWYKSGNPTLNSFHKLP
jgi:soluble lytic murein transglycosylase